MEALLYLTVPIAVRTIMGIDTVLSWLTIVVVGKESE